MSLERSIAIRYLVSKRQAGPVTLISIISVVGVTIGVAALIVVLSVFNGFSGLVTSILINFDPHIRIESPQQTDMTTYEPVIEFAERQEEISGIAPFAVGKAVVVSRNLNRVINIKGIDTERITSVSGLKEKIVLGGLDLGSGNHNGIVLGMTLADRLGAVLDDTLSVVSLAGTEMALLQLGQPLIRRFRVVGIYESNNKEYDSFYAFVRLDAAQSLFSMDRNVSGLELRLNAIEQSDDFKATLLDRFGSSFRVLTWYDLHRDLYSVMKIERWMAYIILCLIIGVASFNLLGSLTMSVIEKTRDIGVLKSMGATDKSIVRIFMFEGILVGVLGSTLGLGLGVLLVYLQQTHHLFPLDPTVYIIPAIPVDIHVIDLLVVTMTAIGLCSLAALYPAKRAANLIPVEAIRWE
ncbi:MAG: FtsX-like permease family protein [Ignavibacteria bacterium]|nr:FtsX-like permease family protein [Ignavibacteria bacterium]